MNRIEKACTECASDLRLGLTADGIPVRKEMNCPGCGVALVVYVSYYASGRAIVNVEPHHNLTTAL